MSVDSVICWSDWPWTWRRQGWGCRCPTEVGSGCGPRRPVGRAPPPERETPAPSPAALDGDRASCTGLQACRTERVKVLPHGGIFHNNNVHLSCAHQRLEHSHDTYSPNILYRRREHSPTKTIYVSFLFQKKEEKKKKKAGGGGVGGEERVIVLLKGGVFDYHLAYHDLFFLTEEFWLVIQDGGWQIQGHFESFLFSVIQNKNKKGGILIGNSRRRMIDLRTLQDYLCISSDKLNWRVVSTKKRRKKEKKKRGNVGNSRRMRTDSRTFWEVYRDNGSGVNKNNSNTTFCSEFSVFLKRFSMNCDWRMPSISQIAYGSGDEFTGFMPE